MFKKGQLVVRLNWNIFVIILNKSIGIIYHNYIALHFVYSIYLTLILLKKKGWFKFLELFRDLLESLRGKRVSDFPFWLTLMLQVMSCTWCPAGCSTISSASLPRWLSRAQQTHILQTHRLLSLQIGCLTMPQHKVDNPSLSDY